VTTTRFSHLKTRRGDVAFLVVVVVTATRHNHLKTSFIDDAYLVNTYIIVTSTELDNLKARRAYLQLGLIT
jgi:hypothetical protein